VRKVDSPARWLAPEEIVAVAFDRSRLVLANEAHDGFCRCVRTRAVGVRLVRAADGVGVRHLAMEALYDRKLTAAANRERQLPQVGSGYLAQAEMRALITAALQLGWTLVAYEADMSRKPPCDDMSLKTTNWREEQQARNLTKAVSALRGQPMLVWCGNHHLAKDADSEWRSMGSRLEDLCGIEPFAIDQVLGVSFDQDSRPPAEAWSTAFAENLCGYGGTAGFLAEDAPNGWPCPDLADAFLLSIDNGMT
jgi:hypothetical protein